jgi:hypothetical protein
MSKQPDVLATNRIENNDRPESDTGLRCVVCRRAFQFGVDDAPHIVRHICYGYDFVHGGECRLTAESTLFAEPGYDCAAFGPDPDRRRLTGLISPRGWTAILPPNSHTAECGLDPIWSWALVEGKNGVIRVEGLIRDQDWQDGPGSFYFPEARQGASAIVGYAPPVACLASTAAKL